MTRAVHKSDCLVDPAVSEEYTNDEVYYVVGISVVSTHCVTLKSCFLGVSTYTVAVTPSIFLVTGGSEGSSSN